MTLSITPVSVDRVEELQAISIATFTDTFAKDNTAEDLAQYLADAYSIERLKNELNNPDSEFYFVTLDEQVVGYLKLNLGSAQHEEVGANAMEIERIYIATSHKRLGLGSLLITFAMARARQAQLSSVCLGVWEHNDAARRFYERMGFKTVGSHVFMLGSDEQTDLLMQHML